MIASSTDTRHAARRDASASRPPSPWLLLLEARAPWEYAALLAARPWLNHLPPGDGHPVIVYPGLGASETSTRPLRGFLQERGYKVYDWGLGPNHGPQPGVLAACRRQVAEVAQRHGEKVSLVGWSLGGIYARELAKQIETDTRCVVTLGSPFAGDPRASNATRAYEMLSGQRIDDDVERRAHLRRAPRVPTSSIYSKSDGIVAWQCSLNDDAPHTENIEVQASHIGLGVNPMALYAVADRLRQDPTAWQRFDAKLAHRWVFGGERAMQD